MIDRWLEDAADRLETAAEIVGELNASAWVSSDSLQKQLTSLEEALCHTSERLGLLRNLNADMRRRYLRTLDDLSTAAQRCLRLACAEESGAAYDGLDIVAADVASLVIELQTLDRLDANKPTEAAKGGMRRLRVGSGGTR